MDSKNLEINYENVADLKPADYNPRIMQTADFEKLKKGLKEFGFVEPIVKNADGTLIGGHQRLRAAIELGFKTVPVVTVDLDKTREKALNLALNKITGDWDFGRVQSLIKELESVPDFDVELSGFDVELPSLDIPGPIMGQPVPAQQVNPAMDMQSAAPTCTSEYEPTVQHNPVTAQDINKSQNEIDNRFSGEQKLNNTICPYCGEEFSVG